MKKVSFSTEEALGSFQTVRKEQLSQKEQWKKRDTYSFRTVIFGMEAAYAQKHMYAELAEFLCLITTLRFTDFNNDLTQPDTFL